MKFNQEVCKAFFNFDSGLNKGDGIVSSIYGLIGRNRSLNEAYFKNLERRIEREATLCKTNTSFHNLLIMCWTNLPDGCSKWSTIAMLFFTTDTVDKFARDKLSLNEYKWFKSTAEDTLCHELDLKYGDSLTKYAWDVFNISEHTIAQKSKQSIPDIILGCIFLYSVYQLL